jgi:uncharacterized membrane protein YebE (DUF533 family)
MFDAKKLLEMVLNGAQPQAQAAPAQGGGGGTLADMLGKALGQSGGQSGGQGAQGSQGGGLADILAKLGQQQPQQGGAQGASLGGGGLGDLLGKVLGGGQHANAAPTPHAAPQAEAAGAGGIEDLLRKLQGQLGGAGGAPGAGGGLADILGQVLGQAKSGVSEGARRIDDATGASGHVRAATQGATGQDPNDILNQVKDWVSKNQAGAGAAAGGLGAIVLGTHAGRALAGKAIKIGSLALIGGLAYKALQNYQAGRPLIAGPDATHLTEAPRGTGYETAAVTHDSALLYIRAMISAAAADGRIDPKEQEKIFGSLKQAGMEAAAEEFLAKELNNPATVAQLIAGVKTEQEALQVFTAARVAVDVDSQENNDFLVALGTGLGMDEKLMQHIDAAARSAA